MGLPLELLRMERMVRPIDAAIIDKYTKSCLTTGPPVIENEKYMTKVPLNGSSSGSARESLLLLLRWMFGIGLTTATCHRCHSDENDNENDNDENENEKDMTHEIRWMFGIGLTTATCH